MRVSAIKNFNYSHNKGLQNSKKLAKYNNNEENLSFKCHIISRFPISAADAINKDMKKYITGIHPYPDAAPSLKNEIFELFKDSLITASPIV